jgi:protein phosphatase
MQQDYLIKATGLTDRGLKRETNQDSFLIDQDLGLFIVADGMGGHQGGEVASQLAVQTIQSVIRDSFDKEKGVKPGELLQRAYGEACRQIYQQSQSQSGLKGMGTTVVTALFRGKTLYIANVGDSRAYLVKSPYIWQMTDDHSLLNEQIRSGIVKSEEAHKFAAKNVITRSVGFEEEVICDVVERKIEPDESVILCSDGLSGLVPDQRITDVCLSLAFEDVPSRLIEEAKKAGGDDNVTVLYIRLYASN